MIKVNPISSNHINFKSSPAISVKDGSICETNGKTSSLVCVGNYNRAAIKQDVNKCIESAENAAKKVIGEGEKIKRPHFMEESGQRIVRTSAGSPVEGFPDLINDDKYVACYFDSENELKNIFVLDKATSEIDVFDSEGKKTHHFGKKERAALFYYKYHPQAIHAKLRHNKPTYGGIFHEEAMQAADELEKIFSNEEKVFRTKDDKVVYRALQDDLSEEELQTILTVGAVYNDKSYCSTSETLGTARRFQGSNPIMMIELPKDTKYADVERLFNIDRTHFKEQEMLLDKESSFLITGYDEDKNIVHAKYLSK